MTKDNGRKKSEARMSKSTQLCARRFRYSDFVIPSDFVIGHSSLGITVASIQKSGQRAARTRGLEPRRHAAFKRRAAGFGGHPEGGRAANGIVGHGDGR